MVKRTKTYLLLTLLLLTGLAGHDRYHNTFHERTLAFRQDEKPVMLLFENIPPQR